MKIREIVLLQGFVNITYKKILQETKNNNWRVFLRSLRHLLQPSIVTAIDLQLTKTLILIRFRILIVNSE